MSIRVIHHEPAPEPPPSDRHHPDCTCDLCPAPEHGDPYEWRPTWADLDAQNRVLHREVGELHLVVARALDGQQLARQREEVARRGQVEAEAAVARVRAVHVEFQPTDDPVGSMCRGCLRPWPCPSAVALDGAPVASGG